MNRRLGVILNRFGCGDEEKISLSQPGMKPESFSP
jgi:hypothetical protein